MSGSPLRSPAFRWFLAGQTITLTGSAMAPVALAFGVLAATGSAGWLSAVTTAALLPMIAAMLVGGGLADRYRRDTVLRLSGLVAGIAQGGVAVVLLTDRHPALLLLLAALGGVCQGLTRPALRGILSNLTDRAGLQAASAMLSTARTTARIAGPAAAGLLTASVGGGWAIAVDAASFLVAAACFARIALPARAADGASMVDELREGWRYFRATPWIWSVTLAFAVYNAVHRGFWTILGPVVAQHTIGAAGWGLVLSASGVGALLAGAVTIRVTVRRPMAPALIGMAVGTAPLILLGAGAGTPWLAVAAFVSGAAAELFTVVWETVNNTHIPERLLSRVGAHDEFWSTASAPVGQLSAPILAAAFGTPVVAVTGGAVAAAGMLAPLVIRSLRRLEIGR